jgi:hypothetical protein
MISRTSGACECIQGGKRSVRCRGAKGQGREGGGATAIKRNHVWKGVHTSRRCEGDSPKFAIDSMGFCMLGATNNEYIRSVDTTR